jgi:antirestriction protein ArdC
MPDYAKGARADLYRTVTEKIVARIEAGAGVYRMPWHHDGSSAGRPRNVLSDLPYRGINIVMLAVAAQAASYPTGQWATYRQWRQIDAQVREREHGTLIVFWKRRADDGEVGNQESEAVESDDDNRPRPRFVARGYTVFNAAQVDGYIPVEPPPLPQAERIDRAERFFGNLQIEARFGGDRAYYVPSRDYIQMPPFERFRDGESFYGTLLHEGSHASGAPHRLNRNLSSRFGSEAYAMEEMIAEWASAMACASLGIAAEARDDHAAYIADWLKVLRHDPRAVFTAAARAQAIVDWMWVKQPLTEHPVQ